MRKFVGIFSILTLVVMVLGSIFATQASTVASSWLIAGSLSAWVFFIASLLVFAGMVGDNFLSHTSLPNVVALVAWAMTMMLAISLAFGTIHLISVIVLPWYANFLMFYVVIGWPVITIYDWMYKTNFVFEDF